MSLRSAASSSAAISPISLKPLNPTNDQVFDTCTYIKEKNVQSFYGCYVFRSCPSCLETEGCMINDLGICVGQTTGMTNLDNNNFHEYQTSTAYNPSMNYVHAIEQNLSLPHAATANRDALATEQNWHFRAGDVTYCNAIDTVCRECKTTNFWRGNETTQDSDSRFCVGENNCVCIQTCEVPTFKPPGCHWVFSKQKDPEFSVENKYITRVRNLAYWEWFLVLVVMVIISSFFRCFSRRKKNEDKVTNEDAQPAFIEVQGWHTRPSVVSPTNER